MTRPSPGPLHPGLHIKLKDVWAAVFAVEFKDRKGTYTEVDAAWLAGRRADEAVAALVKAETTRPLVEYTG